MDCLVGFRDLHHWAQKARGDEVLGSALRPYGFHTGNMSAILAYPFLLFEQYKWRRRAEPRFTYRVWFNDIEPIRYIQSDEQNPLSLQYPSGTFQFTPAPDGFPGSLTDYWQPVVEGVVRGVIEPEFPEVKLEFHRTSELIGTEELTQAIYCGLSNKAKITELFGQYTRETRKGLTDYVWPLCPTHKVPAMRVGLAETTSSRDKRVIGTTDQTGGCPFYGNPETGDWAMHVRLLQVARLAIEKPDLWFIGVDHFPVSRSPFLELLADALSLQRCKAKMLHAPLIIANEESKMSKSRGNARYMAPDRLIFALNGGDGIGFHMANAPKSKDILILGPHLLPAHVKQNEAARLEALKKEAEAFEEKNGTYWFNMAVGQRRQGRPKVDLTTGSPHLD